MNNKTGGGSPSLENRFFRVFSCLKLFINKPRLPGGRKNIFLLPPTRVWPYFANFRRKIVFSNFFEVLGRSNKPPSKESLSKSKKLQKSIYFLKITKYCKTLVGESKKMYFLSLDKLGLTFKRVKRKNLKISIFMTGWLPTPAVIHCKIWYVS